MVERRPSCGTDDGKTGDGADSEPGDQAQPARRKWEEAPLPTTGPACAALRAAVAELQELADAHGLDLRPALGGLAALLHECRHRDFAAVPSGPAIQAVRAWRGVVLIRLRRQRETQGASEQLQAVAA